MGYRRIIRDNRESGNFSTLSNKITRDERVSLGARGLYFTVMCLQSTWDFTIEGLKAILPDKKYSVLKYMNELIEHGYVRRDRVRDGKGQIEGTIYTFFESPQTVSPAVVKRTQSIDLFNQKKKKSKDAHPLEDTLTREDHKAIFEAMFGSEDEDVGPTVIKPEGGVEGQMNLLDEKLSNLTKRKTRLANGHIPEVAHRIMYRLCYLIRDKKQEATLNSTQRGRVASTLGKLSEAGADFGDLNRFETWWSTFWKSKSRESGSYTPPSPQDVLDFWWVAMEGTRVREPKPEDPKNRVEEVTFESLSEGMQNFAKHRRNE
jgi:hypothetical protein